MTLLMSNGLVHTRTHMLIKLKCVTTQRSYHLGKAEALTDGGDSFSFGARASITPPPMFRHKHT